MTQAHELNQLATAEICEDPSPFPSKSAGNSKPKWVLAQKKAVRSWSDRATDFVGA